MPDSQPNYLSASVDGSVSAAFSGGVDLVQDTGFPPGESRAIRWHRTEGGTVIAQIYSLHDPANLVGDSLNVKLDANGDTAFMGVSVTPGGFATVDIGAGTGNGGSRTVVDDQGKSDYIQITPGTPQNSTVLLATFTWPGGTPFSNLLDLSPLAGFTVRAIVGTGPGDWGSANFICTPFHPNASGNIAQASCTQAGALVSPGAGQTNRAYLVVTS